MKNSLIQNRKKTLCATLISGGLLPLLLFACRHPSGPSSQPDSMGGGGYTGRVAVSIATAGAGARTLMPETLAFTRYQLDFAPQPSGTTVSQSVSATSANGTGTWSAPVVVELDPGNWTLTVTGFAEYTSTEYAAAQGTSSTFTVAAGQNLGVTVTIAPIAPGTGGADDGVFTYSISYPDGASGTLTLTPQAGGAVTTVTLADAAGTSPNTASAAVNIAAGYYDMRISLTNAAGKKAGVYTAAHLYPGMETKADYTFTADDFVSVKFLAGTADAAFNSTTVAAYSDAARTTISRLAAATVSGGAWILEIPVAPSTVYFTLDGKIAGVLDTADGSLAAAGSIPDNGRGGIELTAPAVCYRTVGDPVHYTTLQAAITASNGADASNQDTITLISDIDVAAEISIPSGKHVQIISDTTTRTIMSTANAIEMFDVQGTVTFSNIIIDGGAIGTAISAPMSGIDAGSKTALKINGAGSAVLLGNGAIVQNCNRTSGNGAAVYMSGGSLTMEAGSKIMNNRSAGGGAVFNEGTGAVNIKGGEISGNYADVSGGGVYITSGTFTMEGGEISGNYAAGTATAGTLQGGGGVYISGGTGHTMSGGAISGNTALKWGGGVCINLVLNTSTFTLSGTAKITGNSATGTNTSNWEGRGGGVYIGGGIFKMEGGAIGESGGGENTAISGGGVFVNSTNATFNMEGGTLAYNTGTGSGANGGGVWSSGKFNLSGSAKINANTVSPASTSGGGGGGIMISGGAFSMTGGTIGGTSLPDANTARNGGGLYCDAGTITMSGGMISGNTATDNGGGVYMGGSGTFSMSGSAVITATGAGANDVYLASGKTITIADAITPPSSAGGVVAMITPSSYGEIPVLSAPSGSPWSTTEPISNIAYFQVTPDGSAYKYFIQDLGGDAGTLNNDAGITPAATRTLNGLTLYYTHLQAAITASTGTTSVPDIITIIANISIDSTAKYITILAGKNVQLIADGANRTITRGAGDLTTALISVAANGNLTLGGSGSTITIDGQKATYPSSSGTTNNNLVRVAANGTFTLGTGAVLTNNSSGGTNWGGAIYCSGNLNIAGGTISNNEQTGSGTGGGGIYVNGAGIFTMTAGTISGNKAGSNQAGGGVHLNNTVTTHTMSGGTINGNGDTNGPYIGGGISLGGATITISGSAIISGNTARTKGGGLGGYSGTFIVNTGASIAADNIAPTGKTICFEGTGTLIVDGTTVSTGANYSNDAAIP